MKKHRCGGEEEPISLSIGMARGRGERRREGGKRKKRCENHEGRVLVYVKYAFAV